MAKCKDLYYLMYKLFRGKELTVNKELAKEMNISTRTLGRYLEDIRGMFGEIVVVEKKNIDGHERKPTVYRLVKESEDIAKVLYAFFEKKSDLTWILQLLYENDPKLFSDDEKGIEKSIKDIAKEENDIFVFKTKPFEILNNDKKEIFSKLKIAVKNHEYKTIIYRYDDMETLNDVKCLKLIFTQENWYLSIEDENGNFRLLRVAFIEKILHSNKSTFQLNRVKKYNNFFENMQNAMSLQGKPLQTAVVMASPKVAKYFKPEMKAFFVSQKFLEEKSDGSILFELRYTQALEILPFIKRWLPDLTIISPRSLKESFQTDLETSLKNLVN